MVVLEETVMNFGDVAVRLRGRVMWGLKSGGSSSDSSPLSARRAHCRSTRSGQALRSNLNASEVVLPPD